MKGRIIFITISFLLIGAAISLSFSKPENEFNVNDEYLVPDQDSKDWNQCVQKDNSKWGGSCLNYGFSEEKYTVHLINTCTEVVDLMCCVQRTNDQWSCFYRMDMHQNDSLNAYACHGNGKFLKWVRKAGDVTTKFPSRQEVNDQY
ncbi:MAG: hypothetical protein R2813_08140 [Flavobacteriales bacterium]